MIEKNKWKNISNIMRQSGSISPLLKLLMKPRRSSSIIDSELKITKKHFLPSLVHIDSCIKPVNSIGINTELVLGELNVD